MRFERKHVQQVIKRVKLNKKMQTYLKYNFRISIKFVL